MAILGWISVFVALAGVLILGFGAYLAFTYRNGDNDSTWGSYTVMAGTAVYFLGWILFAAYLFFSKQLDLDENTVRRARALLPDPDEMRSVLQEDDEEFSRKFQREYAGLQG